MNALVINSREGGDLRRHRAHNDVIGMYLIPVTVILVPVGLR